MEVGWAVMLAFKYISEMPRLLASVSRAEIRAVPTPCPFYGDVRNADLIKLDG